MDTHIRRATAADAAGAVDTLRRSITELCAPDHQHNPVIISSWLSNKTVETWLKWIARDDAVVLVAERDDKIAGVGMASLCGEILLNYVHPKARFEGVSKAILVALEAELRLHKVQHCQLESTVTAVTFYESRGFGAAPRKGLFLTKIL